MSLNCYGACRLEVTFREFCLTAYGMPDFAGTSDQSQKGGFGSGIFGARYAFACEHTAADSHGGCLLRYFCALFSVRKAHVFRQEGLTLSV